jgi:carnosine N-methyltransferase
MHRPLVGWRSVVGPVSPLQESRIIRHSSVHLLKSADHRRFFVAIMKNFQEERRALFIASVVLMEHYPSAFVEHFDFTATIRTLTLRSGVFTAVVVAITAGLFLFGMPASSSELPPLFPDTLDSSSSTQDNIKTASFHIPFIDISGSDAPSSSSYSSTYRVIYRSLEQYRSEVSKGIETLGRSLEIALYHEELYDHIIEPSARLSTKLERRIENLAACLEHDEMVLKRLLQPLDAFRALSDKENSNDDHLKDKRTSQSNPNHPPSQILPTMSSKNSSQLVEDHSYNSAVQIVAHMVRDWSTSGSAIRENLYDWCRMQLASHHQISKASDRIFVPGAGLGRLAFDLYQQGYQVEANEISPVMVAAANAILQRNITGALHPFGLDHMSNEVDSNRRYDEIHFPDISISNSTTSTGSLSYTIGDLVGPYYQSKSHAHSFGAVITCFFIDTATNIYEYLQMMQHLIRPGGLWVNVGPVQWHRHAVLQPSVDELYDLVVSFGFDILYWKIDVNPVAYRHCEDPVDDASFVRTTNYEAYRPLRFVAIRRDKGSC